MTTWSSGSQARIDCVHVYVDGGAQPNPGHSGAGVVVVDDQGKELKRKSYYLGPRHTNNEAEYLAILKGLDLAAGYCRRTVTVYSDSQLVVKQLNREYRIKAENLLPLQRQIAMAQSTFETATYVDVSSQNLWIKIAHNLSDQAIATRGSP